MSIHESSTDASSPTTPVEASVAVHKAGVEVSTTSLSPARLTATGVVASRPPTPESTATVTTPVVEASTVSESDVLADATSESQILEATIEQRLQNLRQASVSTSTTSSSLTAGNIVRELLPADELLEIQTALDRHLHQRRFPKDIVELVTRRSWQMVTNLPSIVPTNDEGSTTTAVSAATPVAEPPRYTTMQQETTLSVRIRRAGTLLPAKVPTTEKTPFRIRNYNIRYCQDRDAEVLAALQAAEQADRLQTATIPPPAEAMPETLPAEYCFATPPRVNYVHATYTDNSPTAVPLQPTPLSGETTANIVQGHRQRVRQKVVALGSADGLLDYELLELLLFATQPRVDTKGLAKTLLRTFAGFGAILQADLNTLQQIPGIGLNTAVHLKAIHALLSRLLREKVAKPPLSFHDWQEVAQYLSLKMAYQTQECFYVLFLDKHQQLLEDRLMGTGTVDKTPIYPREIAKQAINLAATNVILAHNHPSGIITPSPADLQMTRQVIEALAPMSIEVNDHIITARNRYFSFNEHGLL